jgi:hypothetical protein
LPLSRDFGNAKPLDTGELGRLKFDIGAVANDLRADLDELLLQARQQPVLDQFGRPGLHVVRVAFGRAPFKLYK